MYVALWIIIGRTGCDYMIERFYSDITVKRSTPSSGTFGNSKAVHTVNGVIRGFIEVASEGQILAGNSHQIKVTNSLYAEVSADVKYGDVVVFDSKNYRLVSHPENVSGRNHHIEALLERLDTDV